MNASEQVVLFASADGWNNGYDITDLYKQELSTVVESEIVLIDFVDGTGNAVSIDSADPTAVYQICDDDSCSTVNHAYTSSGGLIDDGEYIQTKLTTASLGLTYTSAMLTIDGEKENWAVQTKASAPLITCLKIEITHNNWVAVNDLRLIINDSGYDEVTSLDPNGGSAITSCGDLGDGEYGTSSTFNSADGPYQAAPWDTENSPQWNLRS